MRNDLIDEVAGGMSLLQGWHRETPEQIAEFWFADGIEKIMEEVRMKGRGLGRRIDLSFFRKPKEDVSNRRETIAV